MLILKTWKIGYKACWGNYPNDTVARFVTVIAESDGEAREAAHQALLAKKFNEVDSSPNCRYVGKHSISSVLETSPLVLGESQLRAIRTAIATLPLECTLVPEIEDFCDRLG
jgi:hypothetical protein